VAITLDDVMNRMSPEQRKRVEARTAQLMAEEMTLQELRRARRLTQVRVAKALNISQDGVSRLEQRTDLLLSTLRKSIEAMGGRLSLIAEFPDREPVKLSGIADTESPRARRSPRRAARAKQMAARKKSAKKFA
jgi:transcriptional regulator with XRE-family HTH domain